MIDRTVRVDRSDAPQSHPCPPRRSKEGADGRGKNQRSAVRAGRCRVQARTASQRPRPRRQRVIARIERRAAQRPAARRPSKTGELGACLGVRVPADVEQHPNGGILGWSDAAQGTLNAR